MATAGNGRPGLSARHQTRHTRAGSGQSGGPDDQDSHNQTGPGGRQVRVRKNEMAHQTHAKTLPAELGAPAFVDAWKMRALTIGLVFSVIAAGLALADKSIDHVLRGWLLGMMMTFGFSVGGLALLMVQYCSGGKWGLLLRRPLEAMTRTLPLVFVYWVVVALSLKKLSLWAAVTDVSTALKSGWINEAQAHAIEFKRPMLNPTSFIVTGLVCFAIWGLD